MRDMGKIELWKDNRQDGRWEADIGETAPKFWESTQGKALLEYGGNLERMLRSWMTDPEGLNSVWDDEQAFNDMYEAVFDCWPSEEWE